jgi:hypothetical protein
MNKSVIYAVVIAALVIIGGGGIYLFTRSGGDATPGISGMPGATGQTLAKTRNQYLHDIEAAYEMVKKCETGIEDKFSAGCGNAANAIFYAREWVSECFTRDGGTFKSNTNTHACLDKNGNKENG